jgi:hypothetical protein
MLQPLISNTIYVAENLTPLQVILFLLVFLVVGMGLMVWRAWNVMLVRASPQTPSRTPARPKRRK